MGNFGEMWGILTDLGKVGVNLGNLGEIWEKLVEIWGK